VAAARSLTVAALKESGVKVREIVENCKER
jgi:hypothetical protein